MRDTSKDDLERISDSLVELIVKNGRYSKEEILGLRAMGPIQMIDQGVFAVTNVDTLEKAIELAIESDKLEVFRTTGGYKERFGIPDNHKMINDLRVIDIAYTIADCAKCGRTVIIDYHGNIIIHPLFINSKCQQRESFICIHERESKEKKYYVIGNRCLIGVLVETSNRKYKLRLPGKSRVQKNQHLPEIIRAWNLLREDSITRRRIEKSYNKVNFGTLDVLGMVTSFRLGGI